MPVPATTLLAATPVVDIDGTFFVQGGLFLLLMLVLRPLLFRPWLAAQRARHEAIFGAKAQAEALAKEAQALSAEHEAKIAAARERAARERSRLHREAGEQREAALAAARAEADGELTQTQMRIEQEVRAAREVLSRDLDAVAERIVERILGRAA